MRTEPFCDKRNEHLDKKTCVCICHILQTGVCVCVWEGEGVYNHIDGPKHASTLLHLSPNLISTFSGMVTFNE